MVKAACGGEFLSGTPGVCLQTAMSGSGARYNAGTKRVRSDGYIVVGRPITKAIDPVAAYARCVKEFVG
jgi:orotidine-5'-phosphate decarboxylase